MGFGQAVSAGFQNYFNFGGRASRPAYWWFVLFLVIGGIVTAIIDFAVLGYDIETTTIGPVNGIFSLATLIPSLAVSARRLHDIDRTGWWLLIFVVPLIGLIILIVWACQPGTPGPNRYGNPST